MWKFLLVTIATVSVGFFMEMLLPLGDWRWLAIAVGCFLLAYGREIWHWWRGERHPAPVVDEGRIRPRDTLLDGGKRIAVLDENGYVKETVDSETGKVTLVPAPSPPSAYKKDE